MTKEKLEDWEIELIGEVQNFCQIIKEVADEIEMDGYFIEARLANPGQANFGYFNIFSIAYNNQSHRVPIGVLTLKSIGATRTILRIPPRSQWSQEIHEGGELINMGLVKGDKEAKAFYDSQFAKYVEFLQAKLKHYGLKLTWYIRVWRWFKEIIGIAQLAKP